MGTRNSLVKSSTPGLILVLGMAALLQTTSVAATCSVIDNCDACLNPPLRCYTCPPKKALKVDQSGCLNCPPSCDVCAADINDEVTCAFCAPAHVQELNGTCTPCGPGCLSCHYDNQHNLVCDECELGFVMDVIYITQDCFQCGANCKHCEILQDGSTACLTCSNIADTNGTHGYYVSKYDGSCQECPDNCVECEDVGINTALCKKCDHGYVLLQDPHNPEQDNTRCLPCPTECATCSGIELWSRASCTSCVPDHGSYVTSGECVYCGKDVEKKACKNCDIDGICLECNTGWRLDGDVCLPCPMFCLSCDDGDEECDECAVTYGTKPFDSITCDACPSDCDNCYVDAQGNLTCINCKNGYALDGDGDCVSCALGCSSCHWVSSGSYMSCDACLPGYTDNPITPTGGAETASNIGVCMMCPANCNACQDVTNCQDSASCDENYVNVPGVNNTKVCEKVTDNCATPADNNTTACLVCNEGFYSDVNGDCLQCTAGLNCATCTSSVCLSCFAKYTMVDTDNDNTTDTCDPCGITKCLTCSATNNKAGTAKTCSQCETGYTVYDTDGNTVNGYEQCKKCPTGCDVCNVDYSDKDRTHCTNGGCAQWDGKRAYTNGPDGNCKTCPGNCKECSFDTDGEQTVCYDNECENGYAKNAFSGDCDKCPSSCNECEWDPFEERIICSMMGCSDEYGRSEDGQCNPCPNNCKICDFDSTQGILVCSECSLGFHNNQGLCGACTDNCLKCTYQSGSMLCHTCADGYTIRTSDMSCVKCPKNCLSCHDQTSQVLCSTCSDQFSLSADRRSCISCELASFDNCQTCSSVNQDTGYAVCLICKTGYVLHDNGTSCLDTSHLDCPGGAEDRTAECTACALGYGTSPDRDACTQYCFVCGDIQAGQWTSKGSCNVTDDMSYKERCDEGACWGRWRKDSNGIEMVIAGCDQELCAGDVSEGEVCMGAEGSEECRRCCVGNKCNTFVSDLDGVPDSAIVPNFHISYKLYILWSVMRSMHIV